MDANTPTRWTKTTEQSGVMVITLGANVSGGLDLGELATYLTDQGWTRDDVAAFDRRSTCACTAVALEEEDPPVVYEQLVHHCILCTKIPGRS